MTHTMPMGIEISTTRKGSRVEAAQSYKQSHGIQQWHSWTELQHYFQEPSVCTPVFTATRVTSAKKQNPPNSLSSEG